MTDLCAVCNRPATGDVFCPRLTMPPNHFTPYPLDVNSPEWWGNHLTPIGNVNVLQACGFAQADCAKHAVDWRERAQQAENQLERLGAKQGCIGGCGFEDTWQWFERQMHDLDRELALQPPYDYAKGKPCFDPQHCAEWSASRIRKGVAELRAEIATLRGAMAADDARLLAASERVGIAR